MGLLSKLKSLFGAGGDDAPRGSGVDVTVERAPEADSGSEESQAESGAGSEDEPVAEDSDASASTESMVDEEHTDDPTRAAEPSEAGVTDVDRSTDEAVDTEEPPIEEAESDATESEATESNSTESDEAVDVESEPVDIEDGEGRSPSSNRTESDDADEPVDTVKGIGPAYAERLRDAGVETVGDLATADPDELAEQVDLSAKRVGRWVDTANDR